MWNVSSRATTDSRKRSPNQQLDRAATASDPAPSAPAQRRASSLLRLVEPLWTLDSPGLRRAAVGGCRDRSCCWAMPMSMRHTWLKTCGTSWAAARALRGLESISTATCTGAHKAKNRRVYDCLCVRMWECVHVGMGASAPCLQAGGAQLDITKCVQGHPKEEVSAAACHFHPELRMQQRALQSTFGPCHAASDSLPEMHGGLSPPRLDWQQSLVATCVTAAFLL